ncbi:MAG: EF-hand domain-containing protein [Thermomonas sp.]
MKSLTSLLTVSLMLATGAVLAHEPKTPQVPPAAAHQAMDHGKMDMSHMTPADHEKMAMARFAKLDSNNDGMLSKAEFAKLHAMMGMQHGAMVHGKMDHSKMAMQHDKMDHSKMDHSKMDMSGMKSPEHKKMAAEEFAKLDKNKDGKLSKTEIPAQHPMYAHFDMLDGNKDGSISKGEFTTHHGM